MTLSFTVRDLLIKLLKEGNRTYVLGNIISCQSRHLPLDTGRAVNSLCSLNCERVRQETQPLRAGTPKLSLMERVGRSRDTASLTQFADLLIPKSKTSTGPFCEEKYIITMHAMLFA